MRGGTGRERRGTDSRQSTRNRGGGAGLQRGHTPGKGREGRHPGGRGRVVQGHEGRDLDVQGRAGDGLISMRASLSFGDKGDW